MLDYSQIEKYDLSGMHKIYDQWPQIAKDAYNSDLEPVDFKNILVVTTSVPMDTSETLSILKSVNKKNVLKPIYLNWIY